jgi:hypothetical protein
MLDEVPIVITHHCTALPFIVIYAESQFETRPGLKYNQG